MLALAHSDRAELAEILGAKALEAHKRSRTSRKSG